MYSQHSVLTTHHVLTTQRINSSPCTDNLHSPNSLLGSAKPTSDDR